MAQWWHTIVLLMQGLPFLIAATYCLDVTSLYFKAVVLNWCVTITTNFVILHSWDILQNYLL